MKYEFDGPKLENGHLNAGDQEALTSPETRARVRKHIESLISAVNRTSQVSENVELKSPTIRANGALAIPPLIYREYADELKNLARTTTSAPQRALYVKMANIWQHAAIRFEAGLETSKPNL